MWECRNLGNGRQEAIQRTLHDFSVTTTRAPAEVGRRSAHAACVADISGLDGFLAELYIESEVLRLIRLRTVSAMVRGLEPGPETSVRKALADEHGQHVMALAVDLAGTAGMLADRGPFGDVDPTWVEGFLYSRALTIGGGTSEVQRNIIGERVLGLPKG